MIIFLNFAPIEFMGGAEKWMYETAQIVNKREETLLVSVAPEISNFYSKLVLKRNYDRRAPPLKNRQLSLTFKHFLPWTIENRQVKRSFLEARKIYSRYEALEMAILFYFGGLGVFNKTISGIHFPLTYQTPIGFFQRLHNVVYQSYISKWSLKKAKLVHVITPREKKLLEEDFRLKNVVYIPTSTHIKVSTDLSNRKGEKLHILFVGELSFRKGTDILIDVIKHSPSNFTFNIAGNGPMSGNIKTTSNKFDNCTYHGFVQGEKLADLYSQSDILFLPSRAEGFPLVFHEAMANGLLILDSPEVRVGLDKYIEITPKNSSPASFIDVLKKLSKQKINKAQIKKYYKMNYSVDVINSQLFTKLFL